ncbi:hypothetical protein MMC12_004722 [Toensbergia leucococca]|nr:hypothetical protein [Toensbergia leucococca]
MDPETVRQLLPMGTLRKDRPARKGSLRYSSKPPPRDPEIEMFKMSEDGQDIVIAIAETSPSNYTPPKAPPKAVIAKGLNPLTPPHMTPLSTPPEARAVEGQSSISQPNRLPPSPPRSRAATPDRQGPSPGLPRSGASSPTLVRNSSTASTGVHSPVMRSMFPRYDPTIRLSQQLYHPNIGRTPLSAYMQRGILNKAEYSPSVYSQTSVMMNKGSQGTPGTARYSTIGSPVHILEEPSPTLSTPEELLDLWSIANGQGSQEAADVYILKLTCDDLTPNQETISISSSTSQALYILEAEENNISISRRHPVSPTPTIQTCALTLSTPTPTSPLLALIFPKLAELMALDQASSVAVSHKVSRSTSTDLQNEALGRAQTCEASSLLWDSDSRAYYLIHPTLINGAPATFPIEINSQQITILTPANHPSSFPLPSPLLSLTLKTRTLTLHIPPLTPLPSLYLFDTLLTAFLTLSLHLHRTSILPLTPSPHPTLLSPTQCFPPPPTLSTPPRKQKTKKQKTQQTSKLRKSRFFPLPTSHPPTPAPGSPSLSTSSTTLSKSTLKKTGKSNAGYFQPFEFEEEAGGGAELPKGTKALLRLLYWAFGVVVWVLGVGVGLLAKAVVFVGRGVGKL